jgi:hypothetical protein
MPLQTIIVKTYLIDRIPNTLRECFLHISSTTALAVSLVKVTAQ